MPLLFQSEAGSKAVNGPSENGEHVAATSNEEGAALVNGVS